MILTKHSVSVNSGDRIAPGYFRPGFNQLLQRELRVGRTGGRKADGLPSDLVLDILLIHLMGFSSVAADLFDRAVVQDNPHNVVNLRKG